MRLAERLGAALLGAVLLGLAACATPGPVDTGPELGRNGSLVVAQVRPGETADVLARRYSGRAGEGWRVSALDGGPVRPGAAAIITLGAGGQAAAARVPILCYHRFTASPRGSSAMDVGAADFDAQLQWLQDNGYQVVRLSEVANFLRGDGALPARAVVVTIDDGYRSLFDVAYPILKRRRIPFTTFVITDMVGGRAGLSWDELKEMRASGLADIESHSNSHPDLRRRAKRESEAAYQARVRAEVEAPRRLMADKLGGSPPRFFAYPYGAADAEVVKEVRGADYALALTVQRGGNASWADPMLLHRDMIYGTDGVAGFARRVQAAEAGRP